MRQLVSVRKRSFLFDIKELSTQQMCRPQNSQEFQFFKLLKQLFRLIPQRSGDALVVF